MQAIFNQHTSRRPHDDRWRLRDLVADLLGVDDQVSIKYAGFIMRAHNRGDGGIMALTALVQRKKVPHAAILVMLGIFGAGLFFGDGMITPAISVTRRSRGSRWRRPSLAQLVVPIALVILIGLFVAAAVRDRRRRVAVRPGDPGLLRLDRGARAHEVVQHPAVLQGLSPTWGARFMLDSRRRRLLTLGSVVLC